MDPVDNREHVTEHSITVAASPAAVYGLIADVSAWPLVFGPTVHVEVLKEHGGEQLLKIWATLEGRVAGWTSRRVLDAEAGTVSFRQVVSAPPIAAMGGEWRVLPGEGGGCRVVLLHDFRAVDDDPSAVELISRAVDDNSRAELGALKAAAELGDAQRFAFEDAVEIDGRAEDVFGFLARAELWAERLPHVEAVDLAESEPAVGEVVQHLDMRTLAADGSRHDTSSVRLCFPERRTLVYKQRKTPVALSGHTGRWTVEPLADGADGGPRSRAVSWHAVMLDPDGVRQVYGRDATTADAAQKVRAALSGNSRATLRHARDFAERLRAAARTGA
ncbi:cyclase [Streptomyces fodineus]|uniref:Cyclase n=1 Tax=Streptomyces fodineus TaxID=1904616 RepID=A0A1D7YBT1_9ACTN|nr:aromatase/cyclase [Streptomyces fodineus]AOR32920.1 cyclase [Streptomyces fodineus]